MYKQFLRAIPSLFARHTDARARGVSRKVSRGTTGFSICSYQISRPRAITSFPTEFRLRARARARNFRSSFARSLALSLPHDFPSTDPLCLPPPPFDPFYEGNNSNRVYFLKALRMPVHAANSLCEKRPRHFRKFSSSRQHSKILV